MQTINADIVIIGAGSGGLSLAAGAVQMGARVVLFEGGEMGGDCLNSGCVPSKALLAVAKAAHYARSNARFGVHVADKKIDFAAAKDYVDIVSMNSSENISYILVIIIFVSYFCHLII